MGGPSLWRCVSVGVCVLGVAAGHGTAQAVAQTPTRSCVRIEVSSPSGSASSAPRVRPTSPLVGTTPSFSATRILDLTFTMLFPAALQGEHVVELRVFTPDAQLYRSLSTPFAHGAAPNAVRPVDGYARPLAQQPLQRVRRGRVPFAAVATTFPVGGTDIVSSGLYGRWRVEAYLDGAEQRCGPAASFNLNP